MGQSSASGAFTEQQSAASPSTASSTSSTVGVQGVESTDGGAHFLCHLYFQLQEVTLPPCVAKVWLSEVRNIHKEDVTPGDVGWYQFGRFRKASSCVAVTACVCLCFNNVCVHTITLFLLFIRLVLPTCQVGSQREIVVRAPRKSPTLRHTYVHCGSDGNGLPSVGRVYGILHVHGRSYVLLRWFTPTFPGSAKRLQHSIISNNYTHLSLTVACAVINIDQIERVVHVVPDFCVFTPTRQLFHLNSTPLGTTLRSAAKELAYTLEETDDTHVHGSSNALTELITFIGSS